MRFVHPDRPGRAVRLAYCLNLHPAGTVEGLLDGLRRITLPLRERLAPGREFGVGMYAPAELALRLVSPGGESEVLQLAAFLREHGLDPFTWNAFPYGGFGTSGLKQRVFQPSWLDDGLERVHYTAAVATLAASLAAEPAPERHLSISTHTGWHSSAGPVPGHAAAAVARFAIVLAGLRRLGQQARRPLVLALEPEPRANCNDSAELVGWRRELARIGDEQGLGTCLDTCHAAVEFEEPEASLANAAADGHRLGKIQFTSALVLRASRRSDLEPLLALDEPRYLHQVTARAADGRLLRVGDLPELREQIGGLGGERWWREAELRCHFHVPVDLAEVGASGLGTTRAHADATLAAALARPELWGTEELHVEIETYTWDVLPREARGAGELVDGLEREYAHVLALLDRAGWQPA